MKERAFTVTGFFILLFMESYCFADNGLIVVRIHNETTGYFDTPAEMLIIDSQGRRTGYSPDAPFDEVHQLNRFDEIPEGMYSQEGVGSSSDEDPYAVDDSGLSNSRELRLQEAVQEKYTLQIIGRKTGRYSFDGAFEKSDGSLQTLENSLGFIVQGETTTISIDYDPTPGTPGPVITKTVTFDGLRNDVPVAQKLNQLGDDTFVRSLVKNIDLAEKLSAQCDKRRHGKDKGCAPAVSVLKLFIKRLEIANHKCDSKKPQACAEEKDWDAFGRAHRKDHDYDDFFREWDRDDWHNYKKTCKRFITDEALKIIKEDAQWLIKSLSGEVKDDHDAKK